MTMRARSITAACSLALFACAGACSDSTSTPDAMIPSGGGPPSTGGSDAIGGEISGGGGDEAMPPGLGEGTAGTPEPMMASGGDGGGAPMVTPPVVAEGGAGGSSEGAGGVAMGGDGGAGGAADDGEPPYDTGVVLGCDDDPNPDDPTVGWTPIEDPWPPPAGQEYPHLEHPYDLPDQDDCVTELPMDERDSPCRFRREGNLWSHWIFQTDETHRHPDEGYAPTRPRIEFHWSHFSPDDAQPERMWTGDVKILGDGEGRQPETNTIIQVHAETTGAGPVYLRAHQGRLFQLGGDTYLNNVQLDTWYNIKVAYSAVTHRSTVYINDCEVGGYDGSGYAGRDRPGGDLLYFKNGSYGCDSGLCIVQFANIKFYAR